MFKVICINNGPIAKATGKMCSAPELIEGNPYTVESECEDIFGNIGYVLEEVKCTNNSLGGYKSDRFIPLSDISETEMSREYNFKNATV